jgi:hypothetical protein
MYKANHWHQRSTKLMHTNMFEKQRALERAHFKQLTRKARKMARSGMPVRSGQNSLRSSKLEAAKLSLQNHQSNAPSGALDSGHDEKKSCSWAAEQAATFSLGLRLNGIQTHGQFYTLYPSETANQIQVLNAAVSALLLARFMGIPRGYL